MVFLAELGRLVKVLLRDAKGRVAEQTLFSVSVVSLVEDGPSQQELQITSYRLKVPETRSENRFTFTFRGLLS